MSTKLQSITSTNGETASKLSLTVFCGHSDLLLTNERRLCVQLTPEYGKSYAHLNTNGIKELISKLESVLDGSYKKFEVY